MSYNENTVDTRQIGLGPGQILIGPYNPVAAGGTPSVSVGAVQGDATFNMQRDVVAVMQGIPAREIDSFVTAERLDVVFTGIQWNLAMIHRALGGGNAPSATTFNFGNDILMTDLSLQYTHRMPNGSTIVARVWKCRGNGSMTISMPERGVHALPYTFTAVEGSSDWVNAALAQGAKLWQMVYTQAP